MYKVVINYYSFIINEDCFSIKYFKDYENAYNYAIHMFKVLNDITKYVICYSIFDIKGNLILFKKNG